MLYWKAFEKEEGRLLLLLYDNNDVMFPNFCKNFIPYDYGATCLWVQVRLFELIKGENFSVDFCWKMLCFVCLDCLNSRLYSNITQKKLLQYIPVEDKGGCESIRDEFRIKSTQKIRITHDFLLISFDLRLVRNLQRHYLRQPLHFGYFLMQSSMREGGSGLSYVQIYEVHTQQYWHVII